MRSAINVIRNEHRAFASVLNALLGLSRDYAEKRGKPDIGLLQNMLDYIGDFPDRFHHPKEDRYLFRLLGQRRPDLGILLETLTREHEQNIELMQKLRSTLTGLSEIPDSAAAAGRFHEAVRRYADLHWSHMRLEETEILPQAERSLSDADWQEIDEAFASNSDPLVGSAGEAEFARRFSALVNRTPPPYGLGPAMVEPHK